MSNEDFEQTAMRIVAAGKAGKGIGTLGEKILHTVIKYYLEPDNRWHEVKVGRYVADILGNDGIIEIQTRNFSHISAKLADLLAEHHVTLVYPAVHHKWLSWIDPETGETTNRRKSPKTGGYAEVFGELARIRPLLKNPNLSLRVLLIDMEETRLLTGWSEDKKRGARRQGRLPLSLAGDITINSPKDYCQLLPIGLPEPFTTRDFSKAGKISLHASQNAVNILAGMGIVERCGKCGRMYTYKILTQDSSLEVSQ